MSRCTVALTIRSFDQGGPAMGKLRERCRVGFVNRSGKRLSAGELPRAIGEAEGVIAGTEPFSRQVIKPELERAGFRRVISYADLGFKNRFQARSRDLVIVAYHK